MKYILTKNVNSVTTVEKFILFITVITTNGKR